MAHDHHHHDHDQGRDHAHPHSHGHNSAVFDELHSHPLGGGLEEERDALKALADAFIEGFRTAQDKTSWLRVAGIPFSRPGSDGLSQHLVDVSIASGYQVATASPGFGSRELVHLVYPGSMVRERTTMTFVYVSLTERSDVDLLEVLATRFAGH